jgi:hypothetical protein
VIDGNCNIFYFETIMKKVSQERSRMIFVLSQMPALQHWDRSKEFSYRESEVCKWLMGRDELWEWVFQKAKDLGAIVFDGKSKCWVGSQTERGQEIMKTHRTVSVGKVEVMESTGRPEAIEPFRVAELLEHTPLKTAHWCSQAMGEFGISRATFYRIVERLVACGAVIKVREDSANPVAPFMNRLVRDLKVLAQEVPADSSD